MQWLSSQLSLNKSHTTSIDIPHCGYILMSMNSATTVYVVTESDEMVKSYAKVEGSADVRLINLCRNGQSSAAMLKDGMWIAIASNKLKACAKAGYITAVVTIK